MFGIKSFFKDIKKQSMDLSIDLNIVKELDEKTEDNNKKFDDKFYFLINKGTSSLEKFALDDNSEKENLKDAMIFFNEALELKKSKPEAYFYLGYISYLLNEKEIAKNYLDICTSIDTNFPNLQVLRNKVLSSL
ncbi:MAG: hypothetical protein AABZ74_08880 [Cyanobacteriota bacterium]